MRDKDGRYSYSAVLSFFYAGKEGGYLVYPNPVTGNYLYAAPTYGTAPAQVTVLDINGRSCYSSKLPLGSTGNSPIEIPVATLKAGLYVLKISNANGEILQVSKFTVVK